ncbi:Hypothetical protein I595_634 [Croceitalea dokdonensis DOKDO 023]|uniref:Uncharacterized protein n=1 Tax=Croceitalea dokdonensis DOKDO 023 TaxID=1300341 RepID=A0A0P7AA17_9FLAO|nr:Hypothetical protein I595_634 [Croceitalea dokdonensis DOKDO 023]
MWLAIICWNHYEKSISYSLAARMRSPCYKILKKKGIVED